MGCDCPTCHAAAAATAVQHMGDDDTLLQQAISNRALSAYAQDAAVFRLKIRLAIECEAAWRDSA